MKQAIKKKPVENSQRAFFRDQEFTSSFRTLWLSHSLFWSNQAFCRPSCRRRGCRRKQQLKPT